MNVNTILNLKGGDVVTVTTSTSIVDVTKTLAKFGIGSIVVTNDDGSLAGIVSERDVVRAIAHMGADVTSEPVSEIMTENIITCQRNDSIDKIMGLMTSKRFRHMPVVEEGKLKGIISIGDVVQQRIAEAELEASAMRSYIATG